MSWRKLESSSRPGRFYYYNTVTKESTWSEPPGFRSKVVSEDASKHAEGRYSGEGAQALLQSDEADNEEEMECERWAEDEEVGMDVELSMEAEQELLSEITLTRSNICLESSLPTLHPSSTPEYTDMLYLVLDTNILLAHLQFLVELKDYAIKGVGRPLLVIPWIVMQELDALKTSSRVGSRARAAMAFLHECFSVGHPRVRGQTMEEVQTELDNVAISNNDDRILHCCLLYQHKVKGHGGVVVLFSNDVQLCSKAMVNKVRALNRKTLLSELRVLCRSMQGATPTSYTHSSEFSSRVNHQLKKEQNRVLADDLLCEGEGLLRDALSSVVRVEMELAFDSLWSTVVSIKPPWTLKDLLQIMDKHKIAVFGLVVERTYYQESLKKLILHVKTRSSMLPTFSDVQNFISCSLILLKAFPKRLEYKDSLAYSLACLDVLSVKLKESQTTSPALAAVSVATVASNVVASPPSPPPTPLTNEETTPALMTLSLAELGELTSSAPNCPEHQLPWVLNIILETTKHCLSRLASSLASSDSLKLRHEASLFTCRLATMLESVTVTTQHLLQNQMDMSNLREFRASLDTFLLTSLQVSCPLSLEMVCQFVPLQLELLVQAVSEFSSAMDTLHMLAQQYSLSL